MKKQHIQQIQDILQTMNKAQSDGQYADCQEGAYGLCEFIESVKGEGTKTVALLEEYCELLFKAHNNQISVKHLKKYMIKIENSVRHELKPRPEIVFLSYKASMSDSIESIYLAAKSDPDCDAYFIPIPYFDRKVGGALGEMHYEGADCYDSCIEITDWQTYDIEAGRPDVIFTFAPYDAQNIVTCIHPNFFCERLRNLTDMLIYVPYFSAMDDIMETHISTAAGCLYAHKVIVQSEKIRESYINYYKKLFVSQIGNTYGKPEEKFVALGSSKFDKAFNSKKENFQLPEEWHTLIGNKKVILYNSSILQTGEQYLKKLRHVLETFRNRDDVVLWWRPHPLSEPAYQTLHTQSVNDYKEIVAQYQQEGWGIYDDTVDLYRAISWTDAYYGDWSSVISVYQITGKPIMIGSKEALADIRQLFIVSLCFSDEYIWFTARYFNGFFKLDKKDYSLEWMGAFPGEKNFESYLDSLYKKLIEINGVLYFLPFSAKEMASYSIDSGMLEKIKLEGDFSEAFFNAFAYKDFIFLTPYSYPAIVKFNTKTKEVSYYKDYVDKIKNKTSEMKNGSFMYPEVVGQYIWLASSSSNIVVSFDMEACVSTIYEVGKNTYKYMGICFDSENFWLSPYTKTNTPVVKWNPTQGVLKEFPEIYEFEDTVLSSNKDPLQSWHRAFYVNGYIYMMPTYAKHAIKINVDTNVVSVADEFESDCLENSDNPDIKIFNIVELHDNILYACKEFSGTLVEYNFNTKSRCEEKIQCTTEIEEHLKPIIEASFLMDTDVKDSSYRSYYYETNMIQLNDFISYVVNTDDSETLQNYRCSFIQSENINADGTAGEAIYAYVKKNVLG